MKRTRNILPNLLIMNNAEFALDVSFQGRTDVHNESEISRAIEKSSCRNRSMEKRSMKRNEMKRVVRQELGKIRTGDWYRNMLAWKDPDCIGYHPKFAVSSVPKFQQEKKNTKKKGSIRLNVSFPRSIFVGVGFVRVVSLRL